MTTTFFIAAKIGWWFIDPGNLFFLTLTGFLTLIAIRHRGLTRRLTLFFLAGCLFLAIVPVGKYAHRALETRFPIPEQLPDQVDGVIVLGGGIDARRSLSFKQEQFGGSVDRLIQGVRLARQSPSAVLVYTGGSGDILDPDAKEAPLVRKFVDELGFPLDRLLLEGQSRNTYQNAWMSHDLVRPSPGSTWILVTSASHMPRAVGSFRAVNWPVIPYPTDFNNAGGSDFALTFSLRSGLGWLSRASHEYIGLLAYWLTGRSSSLFPAP